MDCTSGSTPSPDSEDQKPKFFDLFMSFSPIIFHYFRQRGYGHEDCQDLTQDVFLKAFQNYDQLLDTEHLVSWLLTIAKNILINLYRERQTKKRSATFQPLQDEDGKSGSYPHIQQNSPQELLLQKEQLRQTFDAVKSMPARMRQCFELYIVQGRKYREISILLGISIQTVKAHIFRARQQINELADAAGLEHLEGRSP